MTRNLDDRLADALGAAARTVPTDAVPPEAPVVSDSSRSRPVLVVALAVAAVVAAVAVPLAISQNDDQGQVAAGACPAPPAVEPLEYLQQDGTKPAMAELDGMPFGEPPRVPFTMAKNREATGGYLEDLGVRVPMEIGYTYFSLGRVDCGWIIGRQRSGQDGALEVGRLGSAGDFSAYGVTAGNGFALSPDRTQAVFVGSAQDGKGRITVRNVATGNETAAYPTDADAEVLGWNGDGIWFAPRRSQTRLWRPGADPVAVDTDGRRLTAYRTTDRLLLSDQEQTGEGGEGPGPCVRVAVLDGSVLKTVREKCGSSGGTLSPDGKVLVVEAGAVEGILVDSGARTRLKMSPQLLRADHDVLWEDATHLLHQTGLGTTRSVTIRCDVVSGRCERIQDGPQRTGPAGPDLGRP